MREPMEATIGTTNELVLRVLTCIYMVTFKELATFVVIKISRF